MSRTPGGFFLVEAMIALVLGLLVLAGSTRLFLLQRRMFRINDGASRLQETGRFALDLLARDLRAAGLRGCAPRTATVVDAAPPAPDGFPANAVTGVEGAAEADRLSVRRSMLPPQPLAADMDSAWATVRLAANPAGIGDGDLVLIADCRHADLFRVTGDPPRRGPLDLGHVTPANRTGRLSTAYRRPRPGDSPGAYLMPFRTHVYTIEDTGRRNRRGGRILALARNGHDLFEGVESLQVRYGVARPGQPVRYLTADRIQSWAHVVAVRIGLLLRSREPLRRDPDRAAYRVAGTVIGPPGSATTAHHPADHRLRRIVVTTVSLRLREPRS